MDYHELRRGNKVMFMEFGTDRILTGKIKGAPDRNFPYMFIIKGDDGRTYEVNSDSILMKLP